MHKVASIFLVKIILFTGFMLLISCTVTKKAAINYYTVEDFNKIQKIDAHVHLSTSDTTIISQAKKDNFHLLTVNVDGPTLAQQRTLAMQHVQAFPEQVAFACSFTVKNWTDPDWQQQTIAYLKNAFAQGAIAVKVWKGIGMELKDPDGKFVMIDDPRFDPVFDFLAQHHIPLIGHLGEPKNSWLPLDQMTVETPKRYFSKNPQHHMYLHPEYPSYETHMQARDRMVAKHPNLRFIGAHLASLEWSVDEIAKRLDKFPNMAVDMASRVVYLEHQAVTDWQKVRDFLIKYQDRLLYATDQGTYAADTRPAAEVNRDLHGVWLHDWTFFTSDELMTNRNVKGQFKGMHLPREVIDKIYRTNAQKWLPGITKPDK